MPKWKNTTKGTYKGTEPSPKGLGYCAKGEKTTKKKRGLDGNMWIIGETKNGVKRWIKYIKKSKNISGTKKIINEIPLKYHKTVSTEKNTSISRSLKQMSTIEIKKYLNTLPKHVKKTTNYSLWKMGLGPNKWYYDDKTENIISNILKGGVTKLFKVKIKNNKKNKTYDFTIEPKKNYQEYNIVENIIIRSGGANNTEILIENNKLSKKQFKTMQKNNKYIYTINNVGQTEIELLISISGHKLDSIELKKKYKV